MSLRRRLLFTVALLALLATAVYTVQVYRMERDKLSERYVSAMNLAGVAEIRSIQGQIGRHIATVRIVEKMSTVRRYLEERESAESDSQQNDRVTYWERLVAEDFRALMAASPEFLQLRIIGAADGGRELVRINRTENGVETVPKSELQQKGKRNYYIEAASQPRGALTISPLGLNREYGAVEVPHVPTYRISVPLYGPSGRFHGIAIANVDAGRNILDIGGAAKRYAPEFGVRTWMATAPGVWVVHSNPDLLFGEDLESGHSLASDEPELHQMSIDAIRIAEKTGEMALDRLIPGMGLVHLNLLRVMQGNEARYFSLFHILPENELSRIIRRQILPLIISASLLSVLLVIPVLMFMSRQLAPLLQMTKAARKAATGNYDVKIPELHRRDEVGLLSRAFRTLVDEVKTRERAMRETNDFLGVVLQGIAEGVAAVDEDGQILRVNQAMARIFGYAPGELEGLNVDELVPGEARASHSDVRATFAKKPKARRLGGGRQLYGLRKDGTVFPVELALTPTQQGSRTLTIVTAVDVTERVAAEKEIRELNQTLEQRVEERTAELEDARRRVEMATNVAGIGIWELDIASNAVIWDEWMHALHGTDPQMSGDVLQKFWNEGLHPDDRAATEKLLADAIAGDAHFDTEFRIRQPNGAERWIKSDGTVIRDDSGTPIRVIGTNFDITDIKKSQAMMMEARDAALQASRAKGDFLANMSHEIRTPMNGIIGMSNLLLDTELDEMQRVRAKAVRDSAEALLTIINDILDFSKVEAGKIDIEAIEFDMARLLSDLASSLAVKAHEKNIEFVCPTGVVPPEFSRFRADAGRLRQVLFNLIGNAIKFTDQGEVVVNFVVTDSSDTVAHIRFEVCDTGVGIAAEAKERLFERFTQADTSTTRIFGGTGLGLSISRRLVELMGGQIGVESELGKGSTFWFSMPLERAPAGRTMTPPPAPADEKHRVLLVDDVSSARSMMAELLDFWGVEFEQAETASEAMCRLSGAVQQGQPFKVAVIDQHLDEQSGLDLVRQMRADVNLKETSVVLLRSPGHDGEEEPTVDGHALPCIDKPLTQSLFFNTVAAALGLINPSVPLASGVRTDSTQQYQARALVVEDNPTNQLVARGLLEKFGLTVDVAGNGKEAVEQLAQIDYDIVFMDVHMPVMDGYAATKVLRDPNSSVIRHDVPVIAMTANAIAGEREKSLAAGMNDHLPKPVDIQRLAASLQKWIPGRVNSEAENSADTSGSDADSDAAFDSAVPVESTEPTKSSSDNDLEIFDRAELRSRVFDDDSLVAQLITMYLSDGPRMFGELTKAMQSGDAEEMAFAVHAMKGSAMSIGSPRLAAICLRMETAARDGDVNAVEADWPAAQQAYAALIAKLEEEA